MRISLYARPLLVSAILAAAAFFSPEVTMAQETSSSTKTPQYNQAYQDYLDSLNSANAAAGYTGNSQLQQQMMQPGMMMMPVMTGMPAMPGQPQEEQQVIMRYDKKAVEGSFYGVALPERLFNNVPSDW